MLPGDRLVCALVAPLDVGDEFKRWPLHVTIVPWFRLRDNSKAIASGLSQALSAFEPFEARVGKETRFGPKKNRPANLVEPEKFIEIEAKTRNYLHKKRAWLVDETTKHKRSFRPHVTFQGGKRLREDDKIFCNRICVIEQKGGHKSVAAIIPLGNN